MPRLTLRTLLAYIDDTLEPAQARSLGRKVAESEEARLLIERIKRVTRRRGLRTPVPDGSEDDVADPNTVAAYLNDNLDSDHLKQIESICLDSDVHLAEVAACHQILTLLLTEPVRVPPTANQRMYQLVPAPSSDPNRKPGKTIPVGAPARHDPAEADDHDAALLLGMKRYTATDSWVGRVTLMAAVACIGVFLVLSVLMALPHNATEPVQVSRGNAYALAPALTTPASTTPLAPVIPPAGEALPAPRKGEAATSTPVAPVTPDPKAKTPSTTASGVEAALEPKTAPKGKGDVAVGPGLGEQPIPKPLPGNAEIGQVEGANAIVLTRENAPGARWFRLEPDQRVQASNTVLALPGYKAKVKLPGLVVHLWGNVPEQISMKTMIMQSMVRFHTPPAGYDADFTLDEGRVYVTAAKAAGAKFRVRIGWEVWDVELPNEKSEVMLQAHTAFVPGTPYPSGGMGGEAPRTEAMLVVVRGVASMQALGRFKKFADIPQWDVVSWDSKTNNLAAPAPVNRPEVVPDPDTFIPGEIGKAIQAILSDASVNLKDRGGIRPLLESRMNAEKIPEFDLSRRLATYAYAAILDGAAGEEAQIMVGNLYDVLKDSDRAAVRQAAVMATSAWIGRSSQHTPLLVNVLTIDKLLSVDEANLIAQLLRGYSSAVEGPTANDPSKLFELVRYLDSKLIVVREAALGNLLSYYEVPAEIAGAVKSSFQDPMSMLIIDVGPRSPRYADFLKAWEARAEEIKKWMETRAAKKAEKK